MIEVKQLSKSYPGQSAPAIDGITFTARPGEVLGFLGPNGAGKTTTIRVLTCYHPATSGSARVAGFDVLTQSLDVRRNIGYMPEAVPLYPEMRVREFLRFRGRLRGLDRAACDAAIKRVGEHCWIAAVLSRPIGQLSKGFRQRVGLADALLHNPKVLILDEPTAGLDPAQIRETRALIRELAQNRTVMLSSHILSEVEATCQNLVLIDRGRIVASGPIASLREQLSGVTRLIAELRGPAPEIDAGIRALKGAGETLVEANDGWTRVTLRTSADLRESIYRLAVERGWPLRELRREVGTLEDFYIRTVAGRN